MSKYSNKGYTVIELLTVAGVLVVITGILTGIIVATLRGTNKTQTANSVAQNGNYALSVISSILISSDAVLGLYDRNSSPTLVLDEDGDCTGSPSGDTIELRRVDGGITTLACENNTIASKSASMTVGLLDSSKVQINTGDSLSCYFKCIQEPDDHYSAPSIEVGFTLTDKNNSANVEKNSTADFQTSIKLRNYAP